MPTEVLPVLALVAMFAVAVLLPVNMGALAFVAAFLVGTLAVGMSADDILAGFPGDLFLVLVGITYLFAIAQSNGTVDLLVRGAVRAVGGWVAAIPWVMFAVSAAFTAVGAPTPAACAIMAPIALRFAATYRISPLLMGMMVVHGSLGGGFSPISVYGVTVNSIVGDSHLPSSPTTLFLASLLFNLGAALILFCALGGRRLLRTRGQPAALPDADRRPGRAGLDQAATLLGLLVLGVLSVGLSVDVGFVAITIAVALAILFPTAQKGAVEKVSWSTVLLVTGVLTFVGVMEHAGTIDYVGDAVAGLGVPTLIAVLLCYIGGVVAAFASSTAILGVTIPLAVPFLLQGDIGAVGMIAALGVSSTIVDVSPFSTNGALVLAGTTGTDPDRFYRQILAYGALVVLLAPLLAWAVLVLPDWL